MTDTLADVWGDITSWFSSEESKVAAFLKPIIQEIANTGKADLLQDVITDAPAVATAYATGGAAAALGTAETQIVAQLATQSVQLSQQAVTALAAAAVSTAQAAQAPNA